MEGRELKERSVVGGGVKYDTVIDTIDQFIVLFTWANSLASSLTDELPLLYLSRTSARLSWAVRKSLIEDSSCVMQCTTYLAGCYQRVPPHLMYTTLCRCIHRLHDVYTCSCTCVYVCICIPDCWYTFLVSQSFREYDLSPAAVCPGRPSYQLAWTLSHLDGCASGHSELSTPNTYIHIYTITYIYMYMCTIIKDNKIDIEIFLC